MLRRNNLTWTMEVRNLRWMRWWFTRFKDGYHITICFSMRIGRPWLMVCEGDFTKDEGEIWESWLSLGMCHHLLSGCMLLGSVALGKLKWIPVVHSNNPDERSRVYVYPFERKTHSGIRNSFWNVKTGRKLKHDSWHSAWKCYILMEIVFLGATKGI